MEKRLEQLYLFLQFWFAPWGAAKGEIWEDISGDKPFNDSEAIWIARQLSSGDLSFSEAEIKILKIVAEDA